jgi:hypothetical protein
MKSQFLKAWGQKGQGTQRIQHPPLDRSGFMRLYVADRESNQYRSLILRELLLRNGIMWTNLGPLCLLPDSIKQFSSILGLLGQWGKQPGQFYFAHRVAVGTKHEPYVAEAWNWRVQKLVP